MAAGAKKRSYGWFNKLGVTNSYRKAIDTNREMSKDFDKAVFVWRASLEKEYKGMKADGLDPKNMEHVREYRKTHPMPTNYLVSD